MKTYKRVASLLMAFLMAFTFVMMSGVVSVQADDLEDDLTSQQEATEGGDEDDLFGDLKDQDIGDSEDVGDILAGHENMTSEQLAQASIWVSPVTNIIGYVMGVIIILMITLVGLITALDLLYIAVPPVRNILYKAGTDGTGAYTGGMGAGGYGMGGYGRQGYGMGMMGAGGASGGSWKPTQFVSDEAVACAALLGGSQQSVNMSNGMGGMGMNGMGGPVQNGQVPMRMKSVIWVYIKKRAVFLVFLMVAVMVLTSSSLMGTGVNLAQWVLRIITMVNGSIS